MTVSVKRQNNYTPVTQKTIHMHTSTNRIHVYEKGRTDEGENDEQRRTYVAKNNYNQSKKLMDKRQKFQESSIS